MDSSQPRQPRQPRNRILRRLRRFAGVALASAMVVGGIVAAAPTAAADTPPAETVPAPTAPVVGGYLLQSNPNFTPIKMDLVTHFWWAFSTISNGKCTTASTAGINSVLAQRARTPNLKVMRSIGGWGAKGFSDASATDAARKTLVSSCIAAFVDNGATDGFDLDWEFPVSGGLNNIGYRAEDRENFNLLVDEFRAQLNAWADAHGKNRRDMLLTAALPAGRWQDSGDNVHGAPTTCCAASTWNTWAAPWTSSTS